MKLNTLNLHVPCHLVTVLISIICLVATATAVDNIIDEYDGSSGLYTIEGKVYAPEIFSLADLSWQRDTSITINDGEYAGFLRDDGTFVISGVPSGSFVVEIANPDYYYESVSQRARV